MTAQLLDYPATASARVRQASRPAGVTVAPHRQAPRRPQGPAHRPWSVAIASTPARTPTAVAPSAAPGRLYWTPRGLAVMVGFVAVVALAMVGTLVSAFLAVSPEPLMPAAPAPVLVAGAPVAALG